MRISTLLMLVGLALSTAVPTVEAGVLAPRHASQSVAVRTSGVSAACGGTPLDAALDTEIKADGTTAPFIVPAGMVLVVDGLSWAASGGTTGRLLGIVLNMNGDLPNAMWNDSAIADSVGDAAHDVFVPDIPIKSGVVPCLHAGGTITRGIVHGFLAKDK